MLNRALDCIFTEYSIWKVQKLEGCDLMKCGVNYHGGDQQNGCGLELLILSNIVQMQRFISVFLFAILFQELYNLLFNMSNL